MSYLSVTDLRGRTLTARELEAEVPRADLDVTAAQDVVRPLLEDVKHRGAEAVRDASEKFDGVRPEALRVPAEALTKALEQLDPAIRSALETSIERVKAVDSAHRPSDHTVEVIPGGTVTQRWIPIQRVGLYVPGGRAVLPSSVVMNVVPALVAGVEEIVVASPPQAEYGGLPHPTILAACELLGVRTVLAVGGAQAIGLMAYGAEDLDGEAFAPVHMITGPGNVYVASAKHVVSAEVAIDAIAGPTEIGILADDSADPTYVAADLISQAEHDPLAGSVLVTTDEALADAVQVEVERQVAATEHRERVIEALSGSQSRIILVDSLEQGLQVVNAYGAEHLEIHTRNAREVASGVTSAGAIFVGPYSPVSLGDYCAGSNHVLPTGGSARTTGGLSVLTFLKAVHVVEYDEQALAASREAGTTLAIAEGLPAHGQAFDVRFSHP